MKALTGLLSDNGVALGKSPLLFSGLVLLAVFFWNRSRPVSCVLGVVLAFLILFLHSLTEIYGDLGSDSFREASNFDIKEAFFYLKTLASHVSIHPEWDVLGWSAAMAVAVLAVSWMLGRLRMASTYRSALVLLCALGLAYAGTSAGFRSAMAQFEEAARLHDTVERNFTFPGKVSVTRTGDEPLTLFVYIGESTSALNMQLYGYPRRTTPNLVDLANSDPGLVVFDKMFSTHVHTSPSLTETFSMRPSDQSNEVPIDSQRRVSLVDALVSWGVRVALYSNQGRTGSFNFTSSIVFRAADRHFSIDEPVGNIELESRPLDGAYLPTALADSAFNDTSTSLVVFHSYAGHGDYRDYVPAGLPTPEWLTSPARGPGEASNSVDDYDTAISYVDTNVANAIKHVASTRKPTIFIYFSDHGESPSMDDGHDSSRFRVEMARIPFIVYFNEAARRDFPDRFKQMKTLAAERNISTLAQLVPTILDLMGFELDPSADLQLAPPAGSPWTPFPVLVRWTADGISYLRFRKAPVGEFVDGRTTCFTPDIVRSEQAPPPRDTECVTLETVKP